jgi:hypothetical protein
MQSRFDTSLVKESAMRFLRLSFSVVLALSLAGLVPSDVSAQPSLMIGGGSSSPSGDMGELLDVGYHGRVAVHLGAPGLPVALRAGATYHSFEASGTDGGSMTQLNGTLSAVLTMTVAGIGPYVLGGIGRYRQDFSEELSSAEPVKNRGWHGGAGFGFGLLGIGAWVEARYVRIEGDVRDSSYVPVTFGIKF